MLLEPLWFCVYVAVSLSAAGTEEAQDPSSEGRPSEPAAAPVEDLDREPESGPARHELKVAPSADRIWKHGLGSGFEPRTVHAGFSAGGGPGFVALGGNEKHDIVLGNVHIGQIVTDVLLEGSFLRGNVELIAEAFGGAQVSPDTTYLFGATGVLRYDFATGSRWIPFIDGGFGFGGTDIGLPDLSTRFEFNLQAGAGLHVFLSERTALTGQYRWLHLSNAGLELPNYGTNTHLFLLGLTWFF